MVNGLFTVVMTVWRRELLVPHAIQSVLWQSYPNWELLIYADGVHADTERVVSGLKYGAPALADRISYRTMLDVKPNTFGNLLRHRGLCEARGEYICFLSHDCLLHPSYLEAHFKQLSLEPCVSVVREFYWYSSELGKGKVSLFGKLLPSIDMRLGDIDLQCMAFRTGIARECDIFGDDVALLYAADFDAFDRVRAKYPVRECRDALAAHF